MRALTVLYDARCEFCRGAKAWLGRQSTFVPLHFVAVGSAAARQQFPALDQDRASDEITVIGDDGSVYRGAKAWIMCLWALREYRDQAAALSTPAMMPLARRFVGWVSKNRGHLGPAGRVLASG